MRGGACEERSSFKTGLRRYFELVRSGELFVNYAAEEFASCCGVNLAPGGNGRGRAAKALGWIGDVGSVPSHPVASDSEATRMGHPSFRAGEENNFTTEETEDTGGCGTPLFFTPSAGSDTLVSVVFTQF